MGVPALFRWLSKKYPKTIYPVAEEEDKKVANENGEEVSIPLNMSMPNPNGVEFDNLYLDMNGIVHPCTHPEGKPAPETEEEMMIEVFKYTERVVNMIRPRKLLFMAIDGVAPRAKMNQQRSRRFRSAQEAKEKEEARQESLLLWKAMGKEVSEAEQNKTSWDSNAITPGTPFMELLASSLRFWVVQKMNTDPGWKNIQVLISDATVPGEGEHKIMDFIRRQRSNPGHDPNTRHVIYGLDADLIMLSLATHEPHFRVLREDVFANDTKANACRICGQEGHYAAQCTGTKAEIQKPPSDKKPFIFLDVSILREYLEVELDVPDIPFPFSLEHAIDDWVLLIFFVGNDFLPHLPSLEIREGAIDTLLRIWKTELARMGGYMTNNGHLELSRAQIILEGLARREDEIFRRRREAEERQDQNAKRRKLDKENGHANFSAGPSPALALTAPLTAPNTTPGPPPLHPSLPKRPTYDFPANADSIGLGAKPTVESLANLTTAAQALAGSNRDVVANRRAIRLANMSAAEVLKAELAGLTPVKPSTKLPPKPASLPPKPQMMQIVKEKDETSFQPMTPLNIEEFLSAPMSAPAPPPPSTPSLAEDGVDADADGEPDPDSTLQFNDSGVDRQTDPVEEILAGAKRKFEEGPGEPDVPEEDEVSIEEDDDDGDGGTQSLALKVNADGTVEQEDIVKLWEPGYKERYYRHKFGIELSDVEFRKRITTSYVEGLCWVLHYYYQGTPSWHWYYPYHFAPFSADFEGIDKLDIKFDLGAPFKPFEQLMGVFPAASRQHIPNAFQHLMVDEDSPIIDFYPPTFEIDMNGKKLAWQGVALLPFIDEKRLLDAMAPEYPKLKDEEERRNCLGNNVIFAAVDHPLYPFYEALYGKRKNSEPVCIDSKSSHGMSGTVLPNPECIPGSTYHSPLSEVGLSDIKNDQSLSVIYFFPPQLTPHRSVILPGTKRPPRVLNATDLEAARRGGRPNRGGWTNNNIRGSDMDRSRNDPFHSRSNNYYSSQTSYGYGNERNGGSRNRGDFFGGVYGGGGYASRGGSSNQSSYPSRPSYPQQGPPQSSYSNFGSQGASYGGNSYPRNTGSSGYGQYGNGNRPADNSYSSYRSNTGSNSYGGYGGYGGYGSGGSSSGGGYGGYGTRGGHSNQGNYPSRGAYNGNTRGRGRGR